MDAKIKILILCLLSVFTLQAQTPHLNFAAKFQITSATGGDPYNIVGIVSDDLSRWTGSDVAINDSIYVIDGSDVYVLAVTSITSVVGPTVTLVANDPLDAGVSIPTGQAAILRPTNNYTLPVYISGLRDDLRSMIMNRQAQLIDEITGGGLSITDFISAGVAVPPSAPANLNGGETWRNGTTGELWASDGVKWYPFNYGPKECVDTVTVSLITVQSGGSVTTGSPLIRNSSGVWEHLYNHATPNLIPDGVVTDVITGPRAIIQYCGVRKGSGATPNTSYYVDQSANSGFTTTKPATNIRPLGKVASNGDFLVNAGLLFSRDNAIGVDTISSYTALRAYVGNSNVVYVQNFTYTFNSASYTTLGGIFRKVATGTEDGGTLIVSASGVKWARDWDGITAIPEWWQVGSYDVNGTTNPTRFTRDGVYNNRDRAVAAHMTAGVGGTVKYGTVVKEYSVDIDIFMFTNQNVISTGEVWFRRPISPACWNTSGTTTTTLVVNDASQFRVGMGIMIADTANTRGAASNPFGGRGVREGTRASQISAISGNTITLNGVFTQPGADGGFGTIGAGGRVFHQQNMFNHAGAVPVNKSEDNLTLAIQGGTQLWQFVQIDGNRLNGGHGQFPFAWWLRNWSIEPGYGGENIVIENCTFKNTPGENIAISRGKIENCNADSLGGSFVHYGEANPTTSATKPNPLYITGNVIKNSCMATNLGTGHSEAAILNSNNSEWIIGQNIVLNCKEGFVILAHEEQTAFVPDHKYQIVGNFVENCKYFMGAGNSGSTIQPFPYRSIEIVGNTIRKSGDIFLHFENIFEGKPGRGIIISNNNIEDGRILLRNVDGAIISDNTMLFHTDLHRPFNQRIDWGDNWSQYQLEAFTELSSAILIEDCRAVTIDNNQIEGFETQNDSLNCGINAGLEYFGWPQRLMNADTTLSDYLYSQDIKITNNKLYNFKYGIATATKPGRNMSSFGAEYQTVGWEISNNTIVMGKIGATASPRSYGLTCLPGMKVTGNKIYKQSSGAFDDPIIAYGSPTSAQAWMIGPTIRNNEIYCGSYSETAIQLNPDGNYFKNGVVEDNLIEGVITGFWVNAGVDQSHVFFNDFLQYTLPLRTTPQKIKYNSYALRKNLY